jgi:PAS domain S-box-containing protein
MLFGSLSIRHLPLSHTARPDGYLDYFNLGWLDFLGKSLRDVCGWRWTHSIHPEDVAGIVQKWHGALERGEPFEAEARVRRADGDYRMFLHRKVPLRDEYGTIQYAEPFLQAVRKSALKLANGWTSRGFRVTFLLSPKRT